MTWYAGPSEEKGRSSTFLTASSSSGSGAQEFIADYREWSLPVDYPMVAPNYAARRSEFAKQNGLGRKVVAEQPRKKRAKA